MTDSIFFLPLSCRLLSCLTAMLAMAVVSGCSEKAAKHDLVPLAHQAHGASPASPDSRVPLRALAKAKDFALVRLGASSLGRNEPDSDKARALPGIAGLKEIDFDTWLKRGAQPAIFLGPNGFTTAIGHVSAARTGQKVQILNSNNFSVLVDPEDMRSSGFTRGLVKHDGSSAPLNILPKVYFDRSFENFGLAQPFSDLTTSFELFNESGRAIEFAAPVGTCACVKITPFEPFIVLPRSKRRIDVRVEKAFGTSISHRVLLRTARSSAGQAGAGEVFLWGNLENSLAVSPAILNFGEFQNSTPSVTRRLCLAEVATDKFEVRNVVVPEEFMITSHKTQRLPEGLKSYCYELSVEPSRFTPGVYVDHVLVTTSSKLRPSIEIPIRFHVKPNLSAVPDTIAFGNIAQDARITRSVVVKSEGDSIVSITPSNHFRDLEIVTQITGGSGKLDIIFTPSGLGAFNKKLGLNVTTANGQKSSLLINIAAWVEQ